MSIKQTFKKSESKTNDEIDVCISSSQVVSATTPVICKQPEHSETILSIGGFDPIKKSFSKVLNKHGSYTKYVAMGLHNSKHHFET